MTDEPTTEKVKKERSPSFPFIPLGKAVARLEQLEQGHKRAPTRLPVVATTWGYGPKSSGLLQTVAALKQYGLIDDLGSGADRKVQISDLGVRILVDKRPGAREKAVREAALRPRLIAEYAASWLPERPGDSHCLSELHLDRGFTAEAAKTFLSVFDRTASDANLHQSDSPSMISTQSVPVDGESESPEHASDDFDFIEELQRIERAPVSRRPNRATFPLPEGMAAIEVPENLSAESYEDLKAWIDVILRRAARASMRQQKTSEGDA